MAMHLYTGQHESATVKTFHVTVHKSSRVQLCVRVCTHRSMYSVYEYVRVCTSVYEYVQVCTSMYSVYEYVLGVRSMYCSLLLTEVIFSLGCAKCRPALPRPMCACAS